MVVKGSANENLHEVREIIKTKREISDNVYEITDRAGMRLEVNTKKGVIYRIENGVRNMCNTVETSEKENGYLYTKIHILVEDEIVEKNYAQHSIVAMIVYTDKYDMIAVDNTPVANHKNNCPWDNRADNLEWTTQKWNTLHGKVINSLHRRKFYISNIR